MTFSTMSRYIWGDAPSDPDLSLPLHELVFFAHNDEAFRNNLTVKWIRDYCIINRIPLIEECKPFMQSLVQNDDMRAVTGVYYLEVLDGLTNFCYARENLQRMKTFNTKTEFGKKGFERAYRLYRDHLDKSKGKGNFLATYLELYDRLSTRLQDKSPTECITEITQAESSCFPWLEGFHTVAQLYLAELYFVFAITLTEKISAYKANSQIPMNDVKSSEQQALLAECHALIATCILKARAALNEFDFNKKTIDSFTERCMLYFTDNMSGTTPEDCILKLRIRLNEIEFKNNLSLRPTTRFDLVTGFWGVKVNKDELPWNGPSQPTRVTIVKPLIEIDPVQAKSQDLTPVPQPPPPPIETKQTKPPAAPPPPVPKEKTEKQAVKIEKKAQPPKEKSLFDEIREGVKLKRRAVDGEPTDNQAEEEKELSPADTRRMIQAALGKHLRGGGSEPKEASSAKHVPPPVPPRADTQALANTSAAAPPPPARKSPPPEPRLFQASVEQPPERRQSIKDAALALEKSLAARR